MLSQWSERSDKPAQVIWTISKDDGTNAWTLVETVGSNRNRPIVQIWCPAHKAEEVVALINDAYATLTGKLVRCVQDDPEWDEYTQRTGFPAKDLLRRRGRPPMEDPNESRPKKIASYARIKGDKAASRDYGVAERTVKDYRTRFPEGCDEK